MNILKHEKSVSGEARRKMDNGREKNIAEMLGSI